MADEYISREAAIKEFSNNGSIFVYGERQCKAIVSRLNAIPAADVQPVVRCKNCKYCIQTDEFEYWCNGFCSPARLVRKEDFCSHGKERD